MTGVRLSIRTIIASNKEQIIFRDVKIYKFEYGGCGAIHIISIQIHIVDKHNIVYYISNSFLSSFSINLYTAHNNIISDKNGK